MKTYKYSLIAGSTKLVCPECGKKTFVPYVANATGAIVPGCGRCDREAKCGCHIKPSGQVVEHKPNARLIKDVPFTINPELVALMNDYTRTPLYIYFAELLGEQVAKAIFDKYEVGGTKDYKTIFWQRSKGGLVRAGKIMAYGKGGHRIKDDKMAVGWVHKIPSVQRYIIGNTLKQCFFGEHLLSNADKEKTLVLMHESEKTAIGCAMVSLINGNTHCIHLACGGAQNLKNADKNKVLEGYRIKLVPDTDKFYEWLKIAHHNGWECADIEKNFECEDGTDAWDIMERTIKYCNYGK